MSVTAGVALAVAYFVWAHIKSAGHASDEHLSILETLFVKNMLRLQVPRRGQRPPRHGRVQRPLALHGDGGVEEEGAVHQLPRASLHYLLLLLRQWGTCKHQLAARFAEAVGKHQEMEVTEEELAHMLAKL